MFTTPKPAPALCLYQTFILSVFLFVAVCASPWRASFAYSGGNGTSQNPYQIADANNLLQLATDTGNYDKCFILTADIDLASYTFDSAVIAPDTNNSIGGFQGTAFTGVFDGNGHKIANLTINTNGVGKSYLGLFGYIEGPVPEYPDYGHKDVVKNIRLENVSIIDGDNSGYIGGLAGEKSRGTISNCYSTGFINILDDPIPLLSPKCSLLGGLVGYNYSGNIRNCSSSVYVDGGNYASGLGGLVGGNYYGIISDCCATGNVSGYSSQWGEYLEHLGGLAGYNREGTINNCWASGNVIGSGNVPAGARGSALGGLVGSNFYWSNISNCYATGTVTSSFRGTGGLVGYNELYSNISNCYSTGAIFCTANGSYGGLVGGNSGTVTASFWDVNTSGLIVSDGGTGKTTTEMKTRSTFTDADWDFVGETANGTNDIWRMCVDGVNYPRLWWQFISGDFTCSDIVDFIDFARLANWWKRADCADNNDCDRTDMNLSGAVDIYDLKLFCENWLKESPE